MIILNWNSKRVHYLAWYI